jgi:hypothetical protein
LGQPITFTTTVSGGDGLPIPTGSVYLVFNGTLLGTADLIDGVATFPDVSSAVFGVGDSEVDAIYFGSDSYLISTGTATVTVLPGNAPSGGGSGRHDSGDNLVGRSDWSDIALALRDGRVNRAFGAENAVAALVAYRPAENAVWLIGDGGGIANSDQALSVGALGQSSRASGRLDQLESGDGEPFDLRLGGEL